MRCRVEMLSYAHALSSALGTIGGRCAEGMVGITSETLVAPLVEPLQWSDWRKYASASFSTSALRSSRAMWTRQ